MMLNFEIIEKILTYTNISFNMKYNEKKNEFYIISNFENILQSLGAPCESYSPNVYKNFIENLRNQHANKFSNVIKKGFNFSCNNDQISFEHFKIIVPLLKQAFKCDDNISNLIQIIDTIDYIFKKLNYLYIYPYFSMIPGLINDLLSSVLPIKFWNENTYISNKDRVKTQNNIIKLYDAYSDLNFKNADVHIFKKFGKVHCNNSFIDSMKSINKTFIVSEKKFNRRLLEYTKSTLHLVKDWSNVIFSGGGLFNVLNDYPIKNHDVINSGDIDLFFFGDYKQQEQSCYNIIESAVKEYGQNNIKVLKYPTYQYILELHIKDKPVIQLILTKHEKWETIIHDFDLDYVKVVYDGKDVYATCGALYAYKHWICPANVFSPSENKCPRRIKRIYKTLEKGMRIACNSFDYENDKMSVESIRQVIKKNILDDESVSILDVVKKRLKSIHSFPSGDSWTGYEIFNNDFSQKVLNNEKNHLVDNSVLPIIDIKSLNLEKTELFDFQIMKRIIIKKLYFDNGPFILELPLDLSSDHFIVNDVCKYDLGKYFISDCVYGAINLVLKNEEVINKLNEIYDQYKNSKVFGKISKMINLVTTIENEHYITIRLTNYTKMNIDNVNILYQEMTNEGKNKFLRSLNNFENVKVRTEIFITKKNIIISLSELVCKTKKYMKNNAAKNV